MKKAILGLYCYVQFFALALVFLPIMGLVALFAKADPGRRHRGQWMRRFGRLAGGHTPLWSFSVEGKKPEGIDTKPYVVVSNHLSTSDPFLLSWLPWDMRWVAKEELFKVPVTGWLIALGGDIPLRRGERGSVQEMFKACHETLRAGVSVMLFPEGTRSRDGRLQAFKDGAFQLAIEAQVPLLPVVLNGTRECRPKGSLWFGKAKAVARILEPIPTAGMTLADLPRLRDLTRCQIAAELEKLGAPPAIEVVSEPLSAAELVQALTGVRKTA